MTINISSDLIKSDVEIKTDESIYDPTDEIINNFSSNDIMDVDNKNLLKSIGVKMMKNETCFTPCNPSFCLINDNEMIVNVRYINYRKCPCFHNDTDIRTIDIIANINIQNKKWKIINEKRLENNKKYNVSGNEDIRLIKYKNDIYYISCTPNIIINNMYNVVIEIGNLTPNNEIYNNGLVKIEKEYKNKNNNEKNWVYFIDANNELKVVYKWDPLIIGNIKENNDKTEIYEYKFKKTHLFNSPSFFKGLRGSSNGVNVNDKIWFICHHKTEFAIYSHTVIILDSKNYKIINYSKTFNFENINIEFCIGFMYNRKDNTFLLGYGINDVSTNYIIVKKNVFDNMMLL